MIMADCKFETQTNGQHRCAKCGFTMRAELRLPIHRNCTAAKKCENAGPGTELERILKWFGVRVKRGCGCKDWVRWMNAIGVEGCRAPENMVAIVERLKEQAWHPWLAPRWLVRAIIRVAIWRAR